MEAEVCPQHELLLATCARVCCPSPLLGVVAHEGLLNVRCHFQQDLGLNKLKSTGLEQWLSSSHIP